jgi:excinuclease UvrABC ATPase subunit
MDKPDVDEVQGIAPAIAIRQKNSTRNPRSTSARKPRFTTTCDCCSRASARRIAASADGS